jgi:hypothetical protein
VQKREAVTTAANIKSPSKFIGFLPYTSESLGKIKEPMNVPSKKELPIQLI